MDQPLSSLTNATSFLPSSSDLLMAVPRLLSRAGFFAEHIDGIFGKIRAGGIMIAEPTTSNITNATIATTSRTFIQESVAAAASATLVSQDDGVFSPLQALKNVGSFFGYMTSKWAIGTFTAAILLNRTHFYASSRIPLSFNRMYLRFAIYILPMMLFLYRIQGILRALRCQTSPSWSQMQYGAPSKELDTDFAGDGGLLWKTASSLLFWEGLEASCKAVNMFPPDPSSTRPAGSLALLWPLFLSLGFGQFVETMSCALQGLPQIQEVGMTIFEHSLAFAEAEAVVTKPLIDSPRFWKPKTVFTPDGNSLSLAHASLSRFANVPPEVLLISLISSFSHLTSNFLAVVGLRTRFRLVTTGIWGFAYMSAFAWSFIKFATAVSEPGPRIGVIRFPTVCIVGFIPHLIILVGILACGAIYLLAFGLTLLSPPPGQPENLTWRERFAVAYGNLHANIHLSAITPLTISWHEDFYTAILKVGFTVLTAASEAVYLNEGSGISVHPMTWLEKKRLQELLTRRRRARRSFATIPPELRGNGIAEGIEIDDWSICDDSSPYPASGYGRERKTGEAAASSNTSRVLGRDSGVGLSQRRGRWTLTYQFLRGISLLLVAIQAKILMSVLGKLRIAYSPRWLVRLARPQSNEKTSPLTSRQFSTGAQIEATRVLRPSEPWLVIDEQTRLRPSLDLDMEEFARKTLRTAGYYEEQGNKETEEHLTEYLYNWWRTGGKWGDVDTSGDYIPAQDDDTISISSTTTTDLSNEWSDMDDGRKTPTRSSPFVHNQESPLISENFVHISNLSRLLDPQTQEDREEARLLSRHLQTPGILTRSQYRMLVERDEARVFTSSSRYRLTGFGNGQMTAEQEEKLLEEYIVNRRKVTMEASGLGTSATWDNGAEGMGSEGPQCVVCQISPRTVLVWPCGCLSLCDECRVGLASKNYTTCVCCRTNVVAYSRLYVP
ncbi:ubiquitin-protein ligase-like protein [Lindgomyces ingoldianus]|uniref:Ubiquitin-protein ligase-like protein n=1 Tax=Lindgomyces ingoldianus TaxID=673940 RepID=A0ACB6QL47_9PLEO|nr:ubiquitin-protein ligase-like protein [Lindgomyces ingoldianus]KAF2467597.1 ubiquitin-protein ligase-like protein [Lindgomyces ingoldianus]